jgi:glycosyltransferase involved in cell wall biosynthesis
MKLVICTHSFSPSQNGISTASVRLATGLAARGHYVTVMTSMVPGASLEDQVGGVKVTRFFAKGRGILGSPYRGQIEEYRRQLEQSAADVYIFVAWENWMLDTAGPILHNLPGKKILASHGTSARWRPPGLRGLARRLLWRSHLCRYSLWLPRLDFVVLLTDRKDNDRFYDKVLLDTNGYTNWAVIPNGSAIDRSKPDRGQFRRRLLLHDQFVVLYVSNYHWAKGHETLIRAFQRAGIAQSTLVLIGSETNSLACQIQERWRHWNRDGQRLEFLFAQTPDEIWQAYCDADLFVCPSLTEAQPLAILDAMAAGTPFLSFAVGCVPDLPGGLVARDEADLVAKMRDLAEDSEQRKQLGAAGRRACLKSYNWDHCISEYDSLVMRLAGTDK